MADNARTNDRTQWNAAWQRLESEKGYTVTEYRKINGVLRLAESSDEEGTPFFHVVGGGKDMYTQKPGQIIGWAGSWPRAKENKTDDKLTRCYAGRIYEDKSKEIPVVDPKKVEEAIAFFEKIGVVVEQNKVEQDMVCQYTLMSAFGEGELFETRRASDLVSLMSFIIRKNVKVSEKQMADVKLDTLDNKLTQCRVGENIHDPKWVGQYRTTGSKTIYEMTDDGGGKLSTRRESDIEWIQTLLKAVKEGTLVIPNTEGTPVISNTETELTASA